MQNNERSLPISYNFHVKLLLADVKFPSEFPSDQVNLASKWFPIKIPTLQFRAVHFRLKICNSMITQLQKQWILYYIPIQYIAQFLDRYTITDPV